MKKQQEQTQIYDKECPNCHAYGYEFQKLVKTTGPNTEIVECAPCGRQYEVEFD